MLGADVNPTDKEPYMNRKTALTLALASAFALSTYTAYADGEKKEGEAPQLISQSDEQSDGKKEGEAPQLISQSDEQSDGKKEGEAPQLISQSDEQSDGNKEAPKPERAA
jgi:hypothetical protein